MSQTDQFEMSFSPSHYFADFADSTHSKDKSGSANYEAVQAYSRFCMAMIVQGLRDLLSNNEKIRNGARTWFMHSSPRKTKGGITFEECCHIMESRLRVIGCRDSIDINAFRRQCLENPEQMLKARGNNVSFSHDTETELAMPAYILHMANADVFS